MRPGESENFKLPRCLHRHPIMPWANACKPKQNSTSSRNTLVKISGWSLHSFWNHWFSTTNSSHLLLRNSPTEWSSPNSSTKFSLVRHKIIISKTKIPSKKEIHSPWTINPTKNEIRCGPVAANWNNIGTADYQSASLKNGPPDPRMPSCCIGQHQLATAPLDKILPSIQRKHYI